MLAENYKGKKLVDNVFSVSKKAKEAIKKYGKENVINATIGSLYDENEKIAVYNVVEEIYRNMIAEDLYSYSTNVIGEDDYLEEVKKSLLDHDYDEILKDLHIGAIATAGGTGALSNTIKNYLNPGEKVLLPNWMWGTYKNIVLENAGEVDTYEIFNSEENFNIENFEEKVSTLSKVQKNLIIIINEPSHNPTGFRMTYEEWVKVDRVLVEAAKNCNIILIRDSAYFEYDDREETENRKIRRLLLKLPKNMLVVYAFSLSKSLSIYGLRVGAQVAVSSSKEVIDEFQDAMAFSSRVTWSNVAKGGMKLFATIMEDPDLKARFTKEKDGYMNLLIERANIFMGEAQEENLKILPYKSGFFITVPVGEKVDKVIEELEKKNIFVIKFNDGIRIGICSVPKIKLKGLAKKIKDAIEKV